jgi:6-pyruvoyltetrahydropterin/6-carboxytetrahydropterin synthase
MSTTTITKQFRAEIAHRLPNHKGACQRLHGHSYRFEVTVAGQVEQVESGMALDFKVLKEIVEPVIKGWDHSLILWEGDPLLKFLRGECARVELKFLREAMSIIIFPRIPTAENMANYLGQFIRQELPVGIAITSVRVWETTTSYAEWRNDNAQG